MGGKQRLTRRAALALMGGGAALAAGQTFGLTESTVDRSSDVSVADDPRALLGIERLPPTQFNAVALTNNAGQPMTISPTTGALRTITAGGGTLLLAPGEQRRIAFSSDGVTTADTLRLVGTLSDGGETTTVVDLDRNVDIELPAYIRDKGFAWWPTVLGSGGTVVDVLAGDHDGTVSAPTWVDGDWTDNAALENDGSTDGVVEATRLGSFGNRMDQSFAIAFTIQAPHDQGADVNILGARQQGSYQGPYFEVYHSSDWWNLSNTVGLNVGHDYAVGAPDDSLPDDDPARVVINVPSANLNQWQIYVDDQSVTTTRRQNSQRGQVGTSGQLNGPFRLFDAGFESRPLDGVLDDVILFDRSLSRDEIRTDYARFRGRGSTRELVFATNAGGNSYTAADGTTFPADQNFSGGTTAAEQDQIANTQDDTLYQTERYGNFSYDIPVDDGTYEVVLHFAEVYWSDSNVREGSGPEGDRVFHVDIEGERVLEDYDIVADVGTETAVRKPFTTTVTDGQLNVVFTTVADNAKLSAMELYRV